MKIDYTTEYSRKTVNESSRLHKKGKDLPVFISTVTIAYVRVDIVVTVHMGEIEILVFKRKTTNVALPLS
jgi:hypothetical protein